MMGIRNVSQDCYSGTRPWQIEPDRFKSEPLWQATFTQQSLVTFGDYLVVMGAIEYTSSGNYVARDDIHYLNFKDPSSGWVTAGLKEPSEPNSCTLFPLMSPNLICLARFSKIHSLASFNSI